MGSERGHMIHGVVRTFVALVFLGITITPITPALAGQLDVGGKRSFSTFTQNAYVGAQIGRVLILDPSDPDYFQQLVGAVTTTYYELLASLPEARMAGIAERIVSRTPDLVALQEVSLVRKQSPGDLVSGDPEQIPATEVVADFLQILLDELAARGAHYAVVATTTEMDVEMPMVNLDTGEFDDVRLTDREVILARTDLPPGYLQVSNPQSGNFSNHIVIPSIDLPVLRGWCSVDVFDRGRKFRYVNTHLEEETQPVLQWLQALELLQGPANTSLPVVLAGDLNSDGNHANGTVAYDTLLDAGFSDPWTALYPGDPGLTWGHDPLLADPTWPLVWRIDFALFRGNQFLPQGALVVDDSLDRAMPPFWPSDHAGVAVKFLLK
jgi:endonuclease/exonuclease/phosphatase family metal-dependent hydrolase